MTPSDLIPLQDGLRLPPEQILPMWEFVKSGGHFDKRSLARHDPNHTSLIAIVVMGNGKLYIRDGLHRVCLIHLVDRKIFESEYSIEYQSYESFEEINLACGWVTPFDPRIEVRTADFHRFKDDVMKMVEEKKPEGYIRSFIESGKHYYCVPRRNNCTIETIAGSLEPIIRRI